MLMAWQAAGGKEETRDLRQWNDYCFLEPSRQFFHSISKAPGQETMTPSKQASWPQAQTAPLAANRTSLSQPWPELSLADSGSDPGHHKWALAWSDLMMVLFVLFCVLFVYALNHQKTKYEYRTLSPAQESTDRFGDSGRPVYKAKAESFPSPSMKALHTSISEAFAAFPANRVSIGYASSSHVTVRVKNSYLFEPQQSSLVSGSALLLDKMASILRKYSNEVQVVGHVDPEPRSRSGTNAWQLSAERAARIVEHFVSRFGFSPERFTALALGSTDPLLPGREAADLEANNRLEIRIMAPQIYRQGSKRRAGPSI